MHLNFVCVFQYIKTLHIKVVLVALTCCIKPVQQLLNSNHSKNIYEGKEEYKTGKPRSFFYFGKEMLKSILFIILI